MLQFASQGGFQNIADCSRPVAHSHDAGHLTSDLLVLAVPVQDLQTESPRSDLRVLGFADHLFLAYPSESGDSKALSVFSLFSVFSGHRGYEENVEFRKSGTFLARDVAQSPGHVNLAAFTGSADFGPERVVLLEPLSSKLMRSSQFAAHTIFISCGFHQQFLRNLSEVTPSVHEQKAG